MVKPTLNPALKDFWKTKARFKVLYGGRVSTKSWDAAGFAVYLASHFKINFLCCRQFQNKIEESVYTLLKFQIDRFGLSNKFTVLKNKIIADETGSEFKFYGLWRNIDEVKSLEGIDICWIEEAHNLQEEQFKILEPTIRKEDSEIWITFNPRLSSDFAYRKFVANPLKNSVVRQINYDENPFISDTILETITELKENDIDDYNHIYLGRPLSNDEHSVIQRKWIEAAIDAHKKIDIEGANRIGFDVADEGADRNAYIKAVNGVAVKAHEWKGGPDGILDAAKLVFLEARGSRLSINYDPIGVGASCGAKFGELNKEFKDRIEYGRFVAGDSVLKPESIYANGIKNKDQFLNLKAQAWWSVADMFKNTYNQVVQGIDTGEKISISSDIDYLEKIIEELCTPKKRFAENGKLKVESKEDLSKRGVKSPNLADAFIMAFFNSKGGTGAFTKEMAKSQIKNKSIDKRMRY